MKRILILTYLIVVLFNMNGYLYAVVENEKPQFDWRALKVKSFGEAKPEKSSETTDWKALEKAAWYDGFRRLVDYYAEQPHFAKLDKSVIADLVRQHTSSVNTIYYGDGSLRVTFDSAYAAAFPTEGLNLRPDVTVTKNKHSGIVFQVKGKHSPTPVYKIVAEGSSEVLFASRNVSKQGFSENLMGRWVGRASIKSLEPIVGSDPLVVSLESNGNDLVIKKEAWNAAVAEDQGHLQSARIAIVTNP